MSTARDVLERAAQACLNERVGDDTESDRAYNLAIGHCVEAIRALAAAEIESAPELRPRTPREQAKAVAWVQGLRASHTEVENATAQRPDEVRLMTMTSAEVESATPAKADDFLREIMASIDGRSFIPVARLDAMRAYLADRAQPSPEAQVAGKPPRNPDSMPQSHWKLGNEFKPFHPSASHVDPSYRDGWNRAYYAAIAQPAAQPATDRAIPEGWQLVPKKLTAPMALAWGLGGGMFFTWEALLATAPRFGDRP